MSDVTLTCSACGESRTVSNRPVGGKPLREWWVSVGQRCATCRALPSHLDRVNYALAALAERDAAMESVAEHADPDWNRRAWTALRVYLAEHREFFVDDFWEGTGLDTPPEARALGPIIARAAREGLIRRTGRSRPSVRSHMSDKPVWESTVYDPPGGMSESATVGLLLQAFPGAELAACDGM